jgi:hypothetical protein
MRLLEIRRFPRIIMPLERVLFRALVVAGIGIAGAALAKKPVLPPPIAVCVRLDDGRLVWQKARPSLAGAQSSRLNVVAENLNWRVQLADGMHCVQYPAPDAKKRQCDANHEAAPVVETQLCGK